MELPITATISQIAEALHISRQAVLKRAKGWEPTGQRVQGGGDSYEIDTLQLRKGEAAKIKKYLARKGCKVIPITPGTEQQQAAEEERQRLAARAQSLEMFPRLPEWQRRGAEAKLAIIQACHQFIEANKMARTAGQDLFAHEYSLGRGDVAPWVRGEIRTVDAGTLRAWIKEEFEGGMVGLVDSYGNRKGQSKIETHYLLDASGRPVMETGKDGKKTPVKPMANVLKALLCQFPHWRHKEKKLNEALRAKLKDAPLVSDKSVKRWVNAWVEAHPVEWAHICNPDKAKGGYQPAFGRVAENITGPNQRWEFDATPADLLLTDGRYKILGVIDVGVRRLIYRVSKTERTADQLLLVRTALLTWGVPRHGTAVTDNGKPYVSENFKRVIERELEIEHHICKPFASEEKPFIERSFRTIGHDLLEALPGFCGHNVAERTAIESRKSFSARLMTKGEEITASIDSATLQQEIDRWLENYHHRKHSELGMTPAQALAAWPHPIYTISDERALDVLLQPLAKKGGWCSPQKRKGIVIDKIEYHHPHMSDYFGKKVRPLLTDDLGQIVVYAPNEFGVLEFAFVAENPELKGIKRAELAAIAKHHYKKTIKEAEALKRQAQKELAGRSINDLIQEYREEQRAQSNVSYLPKRELEYTTPGLQAAALAAAVLDGTAPTPKAPEMPAEAIAARERMQAQLAAPAKVFEIPHEPAAKYRLWSSLDGLLGNGVEISDEELRFYEAFRGSRTWRAFRGVEEDIYSLRRT